MTIVSHARVLAAALVLGAAMLGTSVGQAEARDNRTGDNGVRCLYYNPETGEMEFYIPPAIIYIKDGDGKNHILECGSDGKWKDLGPEAERRR